MEGEENLPGAVRSNSRGTTPERRRRNNANAEIVAQAAITRAELDAVLGIEADRQDSERRAAERLTNTALAEHTTALLDLATRLDERDAEQIARDDRTQLQIANLTSLITSLQNSLSATPNPIVSGLAGAGVANAGATSSLNPTAGASGAGVGTGTTGVIPGTAAGVAATSSATAHPTVIPITVPGTTGAGAAGVATGVAMGTSGAGAGVVLTAGMAATTVGAATLPTASTAPGAPSAYTTATSGGTPVVGPGNLSVKDIKIPVLPLLGSPAPAMPYVKWSKAVKIKLSAVGVGVVLKTNWNPSTPEEHTWWGVVNPLVFASLYEAIQKYDTLCDNIARFFEDPDAGRLAWEAIKAFHVKLAEGNKETLMLKLNALVPGDKESMVTFICRCNNLREEYQEYNLVLEDSLLISHLFLQLDPIWRWMCGFADTPTDTLLWDDVSSALLKQDNQRRQGQRQNPLALPLGWVPRDVYNKGKVAAAHAAQGESNDKASSESSKEGAANAAQGSSHSKGFKGKPGGKSSLPDPRNQNPSGTQYPKVGPYFVCFCCLEFGHGLGECPKRTSGWKVTKEQRAKALALRDAKLEKAGKTRTPSGDDESSAVP